MNTGTTPKGDYKNKIKPLLTHRMNSTIVEEFNLKKLFSHLKSIVIINGRQKVFSQYHID